MLAITSLLIINSFVIMANQDSTVSFLPNWSVGEEKEFDISSTQIIVKSDEPRREVCVQSKQHLSVLEKSKEGYIINWSASGRLINPFAIDPNLAGLMDTINSSYEPLDVQFKVNMEGKPVELVNTEDVQDFFITTLSDLESTLIDRGVPVQQVKKVVGDQIDLISDENKLKIVIFSTINTIFSFYNQQFELKPKLKTLTRKLPLFQREVSVTVTSTTENPDPETFIIRAEASSCDDGVQSTILSPEQNQYYHQLENVPPEKKEEKNYAETNQYIINPVTGWLKEAKFHTALLFDGTYMEQLLILSLK